MSWLIVAALGSVSAVCGLGGCSTGKAAPTPTPQAAATPPQPTSSPNTAATKKGPINDACPYTGDTIEPRFTVTWRGEMIGLCCESCLKEFRAASDAERDAVLAKAKGR